MSDDRNDPPCYGATLSALLPPRRGLPTAVALPHVMYNVVQLPGQEAGFLGSAHVPFQVSADPAAYDAAGGNHGLVEGVNRLLNPPLNHFAGMVHASALVQHDAQRRIFR